MGPLYRQCLEEAEAIRSARRVIRSAKRLSHLEKFLASIERERWHRSRVGVSPVETMKKEVIR
jgi:hypothetical protein